MNSEKIINPSEGDLRELDNAKAELEKSMTTLQTELSCILKLSAMKRGESVQILSFVREEQEG